MTERVLVTGAAGCIGRFAAAALVADGYEVHGLSRRPASDNPEVDGVHWHSCDLLELGAAQRVVEQVQPERLLHLGWVNAAEWRSAPAPLHLQWVEATLSLVRSFAASGGNRFVGGGTCMEYRWDRAVYREDAPPDAATWYGKSKALTWQLAESFSAEVGISAAWGRIFFVYGPAEGENRLVPAAITKLVNGERLETTVGTQIRDYLHAEDIGRGFAALIADDVMQGPVNIASGTGVRIADLLAEVGSATGGTHLIDFGARPMAPEEVPEVTGDSTKLRSLGWEPTFSLAEGIADTVSWWRNA